MYYRDNWLRWYYDDVEYGSKVDPYSKFEMKLSNVINRPIKPYYEELLENAKLIRDTFSGPLDLLFSGGVDGEVVLRTYMDLKIPINVYIFKYENNYNRREYEHAIRICTELNVKHTVVDFNLEKFFENEAESIFKKVWCDVSGWLPHMKMADYCDGTPMFGCSEPYYTRTSRDMSKKFPWVYQIEEDAKYWSSYYKSQQRSVIVDWYEYSPEVLISHLELPLIKRLLNDDVPGKLSSFSSKAVVHQAYWPDIVIREKLVGFEGDMQPSNTARPQFMLEFDKQVIAPYNITSTSAKYSADEVLALIT